MSKTSTDTTHFGYREVPKSEKTELVRGVFESVADRYDVMNDLMSMGVHRLWKRHFVSTCRVAPGDHVLDLAGGTGDIAALMCKKVGAAGQVLLSDINGPMLEVGRQRLEDRGLLGNLSYTQANAENLPFAANTFNAVTIAFGLRNVTDQLSALKEMRRVLKPGGTVNILEFSEVRVEPLKKLYDGYSFGLLPMMGKLVAGDSESYQYLAESIRKHPNQAALCELMIEAGLADVHYRNLSGGIVAIHRGSRA